MYYEIIFKWILLYISIFLINCSDNPVEDDGDHARGVGIAISQSGNTLVSYKYEEDVAGYLTAKVGEMSAAYEFMLVDDDGEAYTPEEEHHELRWTIDDTTIAKIWQSSGEEGGFEFYINGYKADTTSIVFKVYHEDHADFVGKSVDIIVTP